MSHNCFLKIKCGFFHCFVHACLPHRPCSQDLKMMSPIHGVCGNISFPLNKVHHASGWGFGLFAHVGIRTSWSSCTITNTIAVALCCSVPVSISREHFVVEHLSDVVILCFVFLVFMGGSEGKATWSMR